MQDVKKASEFLFELREMRRIEDSIPDEFRPEQLEKAYAVQDSLIEKLLSRHSGKKVGYKIACTNKLAQELLTVDAPFYGCLLSSFSYSSPARLLANDFVHRCIEAEFAFELGADVPLSGVPYTKDSIAQFIRAALPSIEIVNWRYSDWTTVGALSLIADNAIHGAWIPGKSNSDWRNFDLAKNQVQLIVNGNIEREGNGKAVLGHPLNVLAWLANELPKRGRSLKTGDFVTTGVTTEVYLAKAGDTIRADFGRFGAVDLEFT